MEQIRCKFTESIKGWDEVYSVSKGAVHSKTACSLRIASDEQAKVDE